MYICEKCFSVMRLKETECDYCDGNVKSSTIKKKKITFDHNINLRDTIMRDIETGHWSYGDDTVYHIHNVGFSYAWNAYRRLHSATGIRSMRTIDDVPKIRINNSLDKYITFFTTINENEKRLFLNGHAPAATYTLIRDKVNRGFLYIKTIDLLTMLAFDIKSYEVKFSYHSQYPKMWHASINTDSIIKQDTLDVIDKFVQWGGYND